LPFQQQVNPLEKDLNGCHAELLPSCISEGIFEADYQYLLSAPVPLTKAPNPYHSGEFPLSNPSAPTDRHCSVFSTPDPVELSASVARIMQTALPENAKIAKDAKECVIECVSEFISFITNEGAYALTIFNLQYVLSLILN
jgi:hypothetical protein